MDFTISELAKAAEIPISTVRYYERVGLLHPENRSSGNYRLYTSESIEKLKFIRAAKSTGFTLDDIQKLIGDGDKSPCCGDVQNLIEDRLEDVKAKLKNMRHVERVLKNALGKCQRSRKSQPCHILQTLKK